MTAVDITQPDYYRTANPVIVGGWTSMWARFIYVNKATWRDVQVGESITRQLVFDTMEEIALRPATVLGESTLRLIDGNDYFTRNMATLLLEVPILDRLTPNPLPRLIISPRLLRIELALLRARRRTIQLRIKTITKLRNPKGSFHD